MTDKKIRTNNIVIEKKDRLSYRISIFTTHAEIGAGQDGFGVDAIITREDIEQLIERLPKLEVER